jgi:hypothetical protein
MARQTNFVIYQSEKTIFFDENIRQQCLNTRLIFMYLIAFAENLKSHLQKFRIHRDRSRGEYASYYEMSTRQVEGKIGNFILISFHLKVC